MLRSLFLKIRVTPINQVSTVGDAQIFPLGHSMMRFQGGAHHDFYLVLNLVITQRPMQKIGWPRADTVIPLPPMVVNAETLNLFVGLVSIFILLLSDSWFKQQNSYHQGLLTLRNSGYRKNSS